LLLHHFESAGNLTKAKGKSKKVKGKSGKKTVSTNTDSLTHFLPFTFLLLPYSCDNVRTSVEDEDGSSLLVLSNS
jgi:hypothetical protein